MSDYIPNKYLSLYPPEKDNILLILHELQLQSDRNYLSKEDLSFVSSYLGLSYGLVYGVATYYGMFSLVPRGKYIIKLCKSPVCHMFGSVTLLDCLFSAVKMSEGPTTRDTLFTIETVECLGQCDKSPCILINEKLYGNLTVGKIEEIILRYRNIG